MTINYNNKKFVPKANTPNGEVDNRTVFTYHQDKNIIWAEYYGGDIIRGNIIGNIDDIGNLSFFYQHINISGEIRIGKCKSRPIIENGKLELHVNWQWLNGDNSKGSSVIEEI